MASSIDRIFGTSVNQAVQQSISENRPLFVYLSRDDAASASFVHLWLGDNKLTVQQALARFVLLKLVHGTTEFGYFEQIFPNLVLPSFYVVEQGRLLCVLKDAGTPEELVARISPYGPSAGVGSGNAGEHTSPSSATPEYSPNAALSGPGRSPEPVTPSPQPEQSQFDHEQASRIRKHKLDVATQRQIQEQEKKRLRELLKADQREREARSREESAKFASTKPPVSVSPTPPQPSNTCTLSIKLFNGSSLKQTFESSKTLNDVRRWLDTESGVEVVPKPGSMASFAPSSYPPPTHYVFHCPVIPRTTYTDEDEFKSLSELKLSPRSALILKPIYEENGYSNSYPNGNVPNRGVLKSLGSALGKFGNALYSFFDYGVAEDHHQ
ncbi:uncharacterized protein CANTADRAFT_37748, partial [Suhomyces tanzawaensis NRRL Y-17324]